MTGVLCILGAVLGIAWSLGDGGAPGDGDEPGGVDPVIAVATDPSPAEGPPRRALDLGWATECAWRGVDLDPTDGTVPLTEFHLDLDPDDVDELYTRPASSDDRVPGSYRLGEGEPSIALPEASVRFRGRSARGLPKRSFSVRLHEPLPALGADRLNLNAMYTDPSLVREHLAMDAFRESGVPAPRTSYVDLFLGGTYEGLYVHVQRVDERLLAEHGSAVDGVTLVRDRSRDRTHDVDGNDEPVSVFDADASTPTRPEAMAEVFDHRGEPDWNAVADLVAWVRSSQPGVTFAAELHERLEVDQLIDFLAIHTLLGDVDAYYDDYWLYQPAGSSRFGVVPWDKDLTFGSYFSAIDGGVANVRFGYQSPVDSWVTRRNRLFDLVMTTPQLRERHDRRVGELADVLDTDHYCARLVDVVPTIADRAAAVPGPDAFVRHPANSVGDPSDHDLHVAAVLDHVQLRAAFLDRQIDPDDGPADQASVHVTSEDAGTSVLFTGPSGWTIARLDILEVGAEGTIEVAVRGSPDEPDVDRRWTLRSVGDTEVRGQLSLYYRNDPARVDWVRDDGGSRSEATGSAVDPVAAQRDLTIVDVTADPRALESVANPFADRVTAEVRLRGDQVLVLRRHGAGDVADVTPTGHG